MKTHLERYIIYEVSLRFSRKKMSMVSYSVSRMGHDCLQILSSVVSDIYSTDTNQNYFVPECRSLGVSFESFSS